jgi:hypothetical protein
MKYMPTTGIEAAAVHGNKLTPRNIGGSVRTTRSLMLSCLGIVTADQLHEFLRMHLMVVRSHDILLWHRALVAPIGDAVFFLGEFRRYRARV